MGELSFQSGQTPLSRWYTVVPLQTNRPAKYHPAGVPDIVLKHKEAILLYRLLAFRQNRFHFVHDAVHLAYCQVERFVRCHIDSGIL